MAQQKNPLHEVDTITPQDLGHTPDTPKQTDQKSTSHLHSEPTLPQKPSPIARFASVYKRNKKLAIPATIIAVAVIIMIIPLTRYGILGLVLKRDIQMEITDIQTLAPISGVEVSVGGKSSKTDAQGLVTIKNVKVGKTTLRASKKYYRDFSSDLIVTIKKVSGVGGLRLQATGRQVPITVTNKITGDGIADATIKAADTEILTDKNGAATMVLPANQPTISGTLSSKDYNTVTIQIKISQTAVKENTFGMSPSGKIYFLSKKSSKIDVVKTDLDGSNRQVVINGTGQEEETNTVLLASRDWKYLALQSRREGDKAKLYLVDTSTDKLTEIDSGDAIFTPVGWHDHYFVYKVSRNNVLLWQSKGSALKMFNAENQQSTVADETNAEGSGNNDYASESLDNIYILKDSVIYSKTWSANYYSNYRLAGKRMGIYSVKPNGTTKQVLKDFDVGTYGYINGLPYKPDEIYFSINTNTDTRFYEYDNGVVKESKDIKNDTFTKFYATYLASPGGQSTFWYEPRDGKNSLFTGTTDGDNPKEIASLSEYTPYGWYSDKYLLVSKGGSELFILPVAGPGTKGQVLKITDYHKPDISFRGYGYGYGGI